MPVNFVRAPAKGIGEWDIRSRRKENRKVLTIIKVV